MALANIPVFANEWKSAEVEKPHSSLSFAKRLQRIAKHNGRSYFSLLTEILRLRYGPGKLSFEEYVGLRLYDNTLYGTLDKKTFIGFKTLQKIWITANYRFDFFGVVNNKIATDVLLGTYGFPILPTLAIYRDQVGMKSPFLLRSDDELRAFLLKKEHYPMFGKPVSGYQSLGTVSISHYDEPKGRLITTAGYGIPIDTLISYVKAHAASGYMFQIRVSPHAALRAICGNRLATVRLLTVIAQGKPKVLSACWKIPAGTNIADNFWRPGNLLAQLHMETGTVLRVVRGNAEGFEELTDHPDSGLPIVGTVVPNWQQILQLVIESAKVIEELALIGWDVAPVDSGAIIVEVNETPDFKLHQLADGKGLLDADFKRFLEERKAHAAQWLKNSRQKKKTITELVPSTAASPADSTK
jgi:hypothetical protein